MLDFVLDLLEVVFLLLLPDLPLVFEELLVLQTGLFYIKNNRDRGEDMRYLIASDIHGSLKYAEFLFKAFEREQADKILLLGDLLYHGPRNDLPEEYNPKAVIELLNKYKDRILCVRGNCDTEVDQMVLEFPIMAEYALMHRMYSHHRPQKHSLDLFRKRIA